MYCCPPLLMQLPFFWVCSLAHLLTCSLLCSAPLDAKQKYVTRASGPPWFGIVPPSSHENLFLFFFFLLPTSFLFYFFYLSWLAVCGVCALVRLVGFCSGVHPCCCLLVLENKIHMWHNMLDEIIEHHFILSVVYVCIYLFDYMNMCCTYIYLSICKPQSSSSSLSSYLLRLFLIGNYPIIQYTSPGSRIRGISISHAVPKGWICIWIRILIKKIKSEQIW